MTILLGSASLASFTNVTLYNNNANYANFNGNATQGIAANASGVGAVLKIYISSWASASIKFCLYEDNNLMPLATKIITPADGTGLVTVTFPNTNIIAGTQRYRAAFYLQASGGINLFTKTGGLSRYEIASGNYTTPVSTLPAGSFVSSDKEFYWAIETAPVYSIDSIDSDNVVELGQTIIINTTGYTGQPTAYTNDARTSVTITGGASNVWTAVVGDRVNNTSSPSLPLSPIQLTLTNLANPSETSNRDYGLTKKSTDNLLIFISANTVDSTYLTYYFAQIGFTVEAAEFYFNIPAGVGMDDLIVMHDGAVEVTSTGTFTGWLRPTTGLGAGKVYYFDITVTEGGAVVLVTKFIGATILGKILTGSILKGKLL